MHSSEPYIYLHGFIYCIVQNIHNNVCMCLFVLQTNCSTGRPKVKDACFPWFCLPSQGHIPQKSYTATDSQLDCGVMSILLISINSTLNVLNVKIQNERYLYAKLLVPMTPKLNCFDILKNR